MFFFLTGCVLEISMDCVVAHNMETNLVLLEDVLGNLGIWCKLLLWMNAIFQVRDIVWDTSMAPSARPAPNAHVVGCVVESNVDKIAPH